MITRVEAICALILTGSFIGMGNFAAPPAKKKLKQSCKPIIIVENNR